MFVLIYRSTKLIKDEWLLPALIVVFIVWWFLSEPGEAEAEPPEDSASPTTGRPHQILEFFEMCCALICTLARN